MLTVFYDCYQVLGKVYCQNAFVSQALNNTPVESLKRREITKICYGVLDKDIELSYYLAQLSPKPPKLAIRILIKIAMYAIKYLNWQPHTVTNVTVELAKKLGKGGTAGYINAVLRNFIRVKFTLPSDEIERMSVVYSYPLFAVKLLIESYGKDTAEKIIGYDEEHSYVRFNVGVDGKRYLDDNRYEYAETVYDNLFDVKGLKINDDFYNGLFTFQSIGSVAICEHLKPCDCALDVCSAPGGKTVLACDKAKNVVAFELHEHRTQLVQSYLKRMKKDNAVVINRDSTVFNPDYENKFDQVLCDVPCSGFGTLKENPDIKLNKTSANVFELNLTQQAVLSVSSKYVKTGGRLIYSTCSVFKHENDEIVKKFLENDSDFCAVKICSKLDFLRTDYGLQFLPHLSGGAGFYVSVLEKRK